MRGPLIVICLVALAVAWLVFVGAGARPADWDATLLFLGATSLFYWMFRTGQTPPRIPSWLTAALWALPAYAAFQLIPLPRSILAWLSPSRYSITQSLGGVLPYLGQAPLAVSPSAAFAGLFGLLACLTIYSLLRDVEWRLAVLRPWLCATPLIAIAGLEASIGLGQWITGNPQVMPVHGTLSNSEHFAGLLEVGLPFALVFGFISFRRHQLQSADARTWLAAARAVCAWLAALMILLALFHTSSQTSRTVVFVSLFTLLAFALIPRLKTKKLRLIGLGGAAVLALGGFFLFVSPTDVPASLAQLGANDRDTPDQRSMLWSNSANLLSEYRWFGNGMGGFEPTFLKYQGSTDLRRLQSPHNDVLAMLIAFGVIGSISIVVILVGVFRPAVMGAIFLVDESRRLLAASITAALFGVLVRSGLQTGLSLPALAMAFAWIAGMSQSSGLD